ncbi:MAG: hypothetical protein IT269_09690 [Saprospiraceae bacterium]|nr:hypothetical protein [Saprospiraceae bacterium]
MTLGELFQYLNEHPLVVLAYMISIPLLALWLGWMTRGEGHLSPWRYMYSALIYAICLPGIVAVALGVYLFLFERGGSIFNMNLLTQVLPVISMTITLSIVKRNVSFESIPGFGRLSGLITMILTVFVLMYIMQKLHLIVWVNLPAQYFVLTLLGLVLLLRWTFSNIIR